MLPHCGAHSRHLKSFSSPSPCVQNINAFSFEIEINTPVDSAETALLASSCFRWLVYFLTDRNVSPCPGDISLSLGSGQAVHSWGLVSHPGAHLAHRACLIPPASLSTSCLSFSCGTDLINHQNVFLEQDLLQLQYEGVAVMKLFDRAKVNVNLLIFLLNKKFYGK